MQKVNSPKFGWRGFSEVELVGAACTEANTLGLLLTETNTMAYQISQLSLGIGALFLCLLLFRTRLVPQWLAG